ncbi:hypothetical protein ACIHDR_49255 [Nocardia sp. NPDC052278]|uniref:hypothetical protein n=1 Tax=unclassified Nocardia TaxID=2637762 RepID=UPI0036B827AC
MSNNLDKLKNSASDMKSTLDFKLDTAELKSSVAIVSKTADDLDTALDFMVGELVMNALGGLGDPQVESAWRHFHNAWMPELRTASAAVHEVAALIPDTAKVMVQQDSIGGSIILGSGSNFRDPAVPVTPAPGSGGGQNPVPVPVTKPTSDSRGNVSRGRALPECARRKRCNWQRI